MPRGINRTGDWSQGTPIAAPHEFGNVITTPHEFGNLVTWLPDPAHFGNPIPPVGPTPPPSGIVLIAHAGASDASSFLGTITTPAQDTTGADFIAVCVGNYNSSTPALTDSKGNTWNQVVRTGGYGTMTIFYCYAPTVGTGHTFTAVDGGSDIAICMEAFSGMKTSAAVYESDSKSGDLYSPALGVQPGALTPASTGDLFITGLGGIRYQSPVTIDSGFTITDSFPAGFGVSSMAYLIGTDTNPVNPTWSVTINSARIQAAMACFAKA